MKENLEVVLGCVMGCDLNPTPCEYCSPTINPIVLLEYCPADELEPGKVNTSRRMKDLAVMGFRPVAIVKCDLSDPLTPSLWAREGLSARIHSELSDESPSIFETALENISGKRNGVTHE